MSAWQALWASKHTPQSAIDMLNAAVVQALADPAVRSKLASVGEEIFPRDQQSPQALAALHRAELDKWLPIIKAANIKAE